MKRKRFPGLGLPRQFSAPAHLDHPHPGRLPRPLLLILGPASRSPLPSLIFPPAPPGEARSPSPGRSPPCSVVPTCASLSLARSALSLDLLLPCFAKERSEAPCPAVPAPLLLAPHASRRRRQTPPLQLLLFRQELAEPSDHSRLNAAVLHGRCRCCASSPETRSSTVASLRQRRASVARRAPPPAMPASLPLSSASSCSPPPPACQVCRRSRLRPHHGTAASL